MKTISHCYLASFSIPTLLVCVCLCVCVCMCVYIYMCERTSASVHNCTCVCVCVCVCAFHFLCNHSTPHTGHAHLARPHTAAPLTNLKRDWVGRRQRWRIASTTCAISVDCKGRDTGIKAGLWSCGQRK